MDDDEPLVDFGLPHRDKTLLTIRAHRNMLLLLAVERHTLARIAPEDFEIEDTPAPAITDHRHP